MTQKIAIIGGSGLYKLEGLTEDKHFDFMRLKLSNLYGKTSSPPRKFSMEGVDAELYFISRHGEHHNLTPSEVPYQANILALKELGVEWIISVSAVGSLQEHMEPKHMVIIDQFIDRTKDRPCTFFHNGVVAHASFGEPICETLRQYILAGAKEVTDHVHDRGVYVNIEGPAFSTRAESELYRTWGASVVGMTNLTEAKLAREAEISYASIAMVTDFDSWHPHHDEVTVEQVIAVANQNVATAQQILPKIISRVAKHEGASPFKGSMRQALLTRKEHVPPKRSFELQSILGAYFK